MQLLPQIPTAVPAATLVAAHLVETINQEIERRVQAHAEAYQEFWRGPADPEAVLVAMGTNAALWLAVARENVRHIHTLARMVDKTVYDYLSPDQMEPLRAFVEHEDGTVTLAP